MFLQDFLGRVSIALTWVGRCLPLLAQCITVWVHSVDVHWLPQSHPIKLHIARERQQEVVELV